MYNPHKLFTSAPKEKALLAGYVCPSYEFQKWSFRIPKEEEAMSLSVFYYCMCDFPCSCHSFNPNSCMSRHFIRLTDCMWLFQGHVTCWNSILTGPWAGSHCFTSRELKQQRRRLQQEWKKSKGLDWQNNSSACASRFFVQFFEVTARLRRENTQFHILWRTWTQDNDFHFLFLNFDTEL